MSSIIQRKAAFGTSVGSGSVAVTLDSPISSGSTLVMSCAVVQTDGSSNAFPVVIVVDDLTNSYSPSEYDSAGSGFFANAYQGQIVPQAGARTYTLNYTAQAGASGYTYLAGICIYELSGVSTLATNESANQSLSNGLHKMSDLSATISGLSGGTYGNLLVSIGAFTFLNGDFPDAQAVAAGSGWTLDGRDAVIGSFSPMAIAFESQLVGPSGNPAATFSGSGNNTEVDGTILVAAYSLTSAFSGGGGGGTGSSAIFLGSVRVLGSAPAGDSVPFLGSVKVVSVAPSGDQNPYLGSVVLGTPGPNNTNPSLGEVCVVTSVPAGADDVFLGSIQEAS
jgi:hypothetical protein